MLALLVFHVGGGLGFNTRMFWSAQDFLLDQTRNRDQLLLDQVKSILLLRKTIEEVLHSDVYPTLTERNRANI